jgi:hypothetical protein
LKEEKPGDRPMVYPEGSFPEGFRRPRRSASNQQQRKTLSAKLNNLRQKFYQDIFVCRETRVAKGNAKRKFLNHKHTRCWRIALRDAAKANSPGYVIIHDEICRIDFHYRILSILPTKDGAADDNAFRDGHRARRHLPEYFFSDFDPAKGETRCLIPKR